MVNICQIYSHLSESDSFCTAVSQDGRSYNPKLFMLAEDVLSKPPICQSMSAVSI